MVRRRAGDRCEYCGIEQEHVAFTPFHVEHIIPRQHGGDDDPSNLALACHHCNLHKGPNLTGIDPDTTEVVVLFDPRTDVWRDHFELQEVAIVGITAKGRATVRVLAMNSVARLELRSELRVRDQLR